MTTLETAEPAATDAEVVAPVPGTNVTSHRGTVTVQPPRWLSSTDHKIIGQLYLFGGLLGLLATVAVNVLIGIERFDGDSLTIDDGIFQLFDAQRVGLVFGAAHPARPRAVRGDRAAAARLPLDRLPPPRRARLLALARRPDPEHRLADRQRRFARRQQRHGRPVHRQPRLDGAGRHRRRGGDRHHGAHHQGAWHDDAARAVLLLVGADHVARPRARAARLHRHADLPVPRPPQRPRRFRRQRRLLHLGRMAVHPAGDLPVRDSGHRRARRTPAGHVPQAHPGPRRDDRRARPDQRRRPRRRHPAERPTPPVVGQRAQPRRPRHQGSRTSSPTPSSTCSRCSAC